MARRALGSLSASSSVLRTPRLSSSVRRHAPWTCHDDRDRPTAARGGGGTSACGARHVGRTPPAATARSNVPDRHTRVWTAGNGMGRPRLSATRVERQAAWRRRHGMAVRPPRSLRARKRQTARDLATQTCRGVLDAVSRCLGGLHRPYDLGSAPARPCLRSAPQPPRWGASCFLGGLPGGSGLCPDSVGELRRDVMQRLVVLPVVHGVRQGK